MCLFRALGLQRKKAHHVLSMYRLYGFSSRPNLFEGATFCNPWIITSPASIITRGATTALGSWHSNKIITSIDPSPEVQLIHWSTNLQEILYIHFSDSPATWNQSLEPSRKKSRDVQCLDVIRSIKGVYVWYSWYRDIIKVCSSKMKSKVKVNVKRRRSLTITIRSAQYRGCSTKEDSTRLALWYRSLDGEFSPEVDVSVIFA